MRIQFNNEPDGTVSAIALDQVLKGYLHQELYYADIIQALGGYAVKWQDSWNTPFHVTTEVEARKHVLDNYKKHNPHSNGSNWRLG